MQELKMAKTPKNIQTLRDSCPVKVRNYIDMMMANLQADTDRRIIEIANAITQSDLSLDLKATNISARVSTLENRQPIPAGRQRGNQNG